ncbi:MAG: MetQ/NlpA family ABC transporter substrate-binding protein [Clostridioides difficile]|nr:MetQ/NlpA family ABC transporter substrate-binding protein [Clostridioides difficile]
MKFKKLLCLLLCLVLTLAVVGCSKAKDDKKIVVGATLVPGGELLEELKPLIKEKGYTLEVKNFDDYILPNEALNNGEIDANLFQHEPYLKEAVKAKGYKIMAGKKLYVCPARLYSYKIKSVDEFKKGDTIAISNNPSSCSKNLRYLESIGLLTLPKGDGLVSPKDIIENPKGIQFKELDIAQIPSSLPDVTAAFIDTTYAVPAGLDAKKNGIYTAPINDEYANLLAFRTEDKDSEKIKVLQDVLTSDKARSLIEEKYKGIVIPTF